MTELDDLRRRGQLQNVEPDREAIERLVDDARRHLRTAEAAIDGGDFAGAYQIAYDAARKSLTAMLLSRGLRARGVGAHVTLLTATKLAFRDLDGIEAIDRFDRVRRTRNQAEYFGRDFDVDEVRHDIEVGRAVVALADVVLTGP